MIHTLSASLEISLLIATRIEHANHFRVCGASMLHWGDYSWLTQPLREVKVVLATASRHPGDQANRFSYCTPSRGAELFFSTTEGKVDVCCQTYANALRQWNVHRQWVGPLPCRRNQKTSDVPLQLESKLCTRGGLANSSPACSKQ